jgi:hypothetical protein
MPEDGDNEEVDQTTTDTEQGSEQDADEQESGGDQENEDSEEGFDGEFDAARARRTINRLRRERNAAREAVRTAKSSPESESLRAENMRLRVAMTAGLDADLADRLRGNTEDELLEDAQKLLDRFYPAEKKPLPTRQPKPALRGGSNPDEEPELSPDDIAKRILGR